RRSTLCPYTTLFRSYAYGVSARTIPVHLHVRVRVPSVAVPETRGEWRGEARGLPREAGGFRRPRIRARRADRARVRGHRAAAQAYGRAGQGHGPRGLYG